MTDLREIGPTYYFAPPRVFENLLTQVMIRMEDASAIKRGLFRYFTDVARRCGSSILAGKPVAVSDRLLYALGNVLVYAPLRNVLGMSRIRVAYTAGAAIGPDLFRFYRSIGINLKQLYGSTETCAYVCLQPDGGVKFDTVGQPAPGVEIKIAEGGEVMVRGPMLLKEYYKRPDATAESLDGDGFFHTGDAGLIDEGGQLKIIDRAKDVGKMSGGAMFAPNYIENKLKFFPHIKEAVAFGNDRDRVCAFINIDMGSVGNWAERRGIAYSSYTDLAAEPEVYRLIGECVEQVNAELAREGPLAASQIRRFIILHKELDPDDDELTRTRKVRRSFIAEKYGLLIDALYSDKEVQHIETLVKFEDGRSGMIAADLRIAGANTFPAATVREAAGGAGPSHEHAPKHRRGGARARQYFALIRRGESADRGKLGRPRARNPRHHRTQRRGQELDAERDQRCLSSAAGNDHVSRRSPARHEYVPGGGTRHRPHIPEYRTVQRHVGPRQHHDRAQSQDARDIHRAGDLLR